MVIPKHRTLELWVLESLWTHGAASMREILERLPDEQRPSYETVRSIIYRLQAKKVIRRVKKVSKTQIFEAVVPRDNVHDQLIDDFAEMFLGRMGPVLERLVRTGRLTLSELQDTAARLDAQQARA